jgi:hypothetical protein
MSTVLLDACEGPLRSAVASDRDIGLAEGRAPDCAQRTTDTGSSLDTVLTTLSRCLQRGQPGACPACGGVMHATVFGADDSSEGCCIECGACFSETA